MQGECELAAYSLYGERLWTTFIEPPSHFSVDGDRLNLDVMGKKPTFLLRHGPEQT